jgi:hypothetical protein
MSVPSGALHVLGGSPHAAVTRCQAVVMTTGTQPRRTRPLPDTRPRRTARIAITIGLVSTAILAAAVGSLWLYLSNPGLNYSCTPWGERGLEKRTESVRTYVANAADATVETYDCDSGSPAFISFTTPQSPAATANSILTNPACRIDSLYEEQGARGISCGSGREKVAFWLEPSDTETSGSLYFD